MTSDRIKTIMARYSFVPHWSEPGKYVWRRFGVFVILDMSRVGDREADLVESVISQLQEQVYQAHEHERIISPLNT